MKDTIGNKVAAAIIGLAAVFGGSYFAAKSIRDLGFEKHEIGKLITNEEEDKNEKHERDEKSSSGEKDEKGASKEEERSNSNRKRNSDAGR